MVAKGFKLFCNRYIRALRCQRGPCGVHSVFASLQCLASRICNSDIKTSGINTNNDDVELCKEIQFEEILILSKNVTDVLG